MIDPARDNGGYPQIPGTMGNIKRTNAVDSTFATLGGPAGTKLNAGGSSGQAGFYQAGGFNSTEPRLMQNAYVEWHDCIPHHTLVFGQFKGQQGEEGPRDSATLDFAERSMIGFQTDSRYQGAMVRGYWWEVDEPETSGSNVTFSKEKTNNRIRYEFGVSNSVGSYFTPGDNQNRPNNNYDLDLAGSLLVRPLWSDCAGKLEVGSAYMGGTKGKGIQHDPLTNPTNDLNRPQNYAWHWNFWAKYDAPKESMFSGFRTEFEAAEFHDREAPGAVINVDGVSVTPVGGKATTVYKQDIGQPFSRVGWYGMGGYNFGKSKLFCGDVPTWLKPFEVVGRYEQFQNIETANPVDPTHTDLFWTKVATAGINYYAVGNNAKIQADYNFVNLPGPHQSNSNRSFHSTHDNSFVLNFQVAF
jgi:hypothetical protein